MDEKIGRLVDTLKDKVQVSQVEIDELISEVREEAFAEARAILKEMMVQAILDRALSISNPTSGLRPLTSDLPPFGRPASASESKERIVQEIESIRKKIAENEQFLSGVLVSPSQPGQTVSAASCEAMHDSTTEHVPHSEIQNPSSQECGYYVYCIVRGDGSSPIEGLPRHGIDPAHPVYTLSQQGLAAVVSQVSLGEFGQAELKTNLNDLAWLESKARAHQAVLEAVMAGSTCVPMRLCTIYRGEQRVRELMAQHCDDFVSTLDRLQGKKEWGVKVYCDSQVLASQVGEVSDRVKELAAQIKDKSGGAAYFLKKKLEEAIAEEVERIGDEYAQHSHDCLSGQADAAATNSLLGRETTHRKDDMLLNAAYLVPDGQLAAFQAELENLRNVYGAQGFSFEMTGPWPPYNFATINLEKVSDEPVSG